MYSRIEIDHDEYARTGLSGYRGFYGGSLLIICIETPVSVPHKCLDNKS